MSDDLEITLDNQDDDGVIEGSKVLAKAELAPVKYDDLEIITLDNEDDDALIKESKVLAEAEEAPIKDDSTEEKTGADKVKAEHFSNNKPGEFCSENFKIELSGLPKYYSVGHLKKILNNTLQLDAHKVKPGGMGRNVCYVNFKNEESRTRAKVILNGYKWQDAVFKAIDADPAKDPVLLAKIDYLKVQKKEHEVLPLRERITKAVTPYHDMSYEDQIKEKDKVVKQVMKKFGNELAQINPGLKKFVQWQKLRRKGQICEMDKFVHSPIKEGYRNKCEFTIGKNKETNDPVVGFRVASYKEGSVEVGPVDHLRHLNNKMKEVVKSMEQFIKTSNHRPFDPFSHEGIWRQLTVRTSNNNDVMIVVVIHPQNLSEGEIQAIKDSVVFYFSDGEGADVGVTSIFVQLYGQKESGKEVEFEHLFGKEYIEETILGKTFRASPDAFLQVNTPACELLYSKISELLDIDTTTVLLDVCCGVGTIGLSVAESAYKVFGVEITGPAVDNARINCEINAVSNVVFYHGRAEDYIDSMIERSERVNTVAIVDPPRAGLNGSVMNAIRKCEYLDTLVYISCDPQAALGNFQALGRPKSKTYKGSFFVPLRATPIDLFPDTPHFELVIVFERYDECKWDRIMAGNPRPKDQAYFNRVPALMCDTEQAKQGRGEKREQERETQLERKDYQGRGGRNNRLVGNGNRDDRGRWSRGGSVRGSRGWGSGRGDGIVRESRDELNGPSCYREQFGSGYFEGYQAGLEAVGVVAAGSAPISGSGQCGSRNINKTQGYAQRDPNDCMDNQREGGRWGYGESSDGNFSNSTDGAMNNPGIIRVGGDRGHSDMERAPGNDSNYEAGYNSWRANRNDQQLGVGYYETQPPAKRYRDNDFDNNY